ncbi:MAG TPA: biotin carboxylase N-terminal domain-containing protein, partial [Methanomassiliicoccales archaeon]|nr:biotin carboxylase N-terminal domain-containing protein [Methanomassiliicoccales archaeon]
MFKKVLVANRGEIAIRVMTTCKRLGIPTVGVYTPSDKHCKHVSFADKSVELPSRGSGIGYLDMDAIFDVAQRLKVEAIHPGYGFLSEKNEFSQRCEEEGIVFIGPNPRAMKNLGSKLSARAFMKKIGMPVMPGTLEAVKDFEDAKKEAHKIGYPIMLKASGGGGGRGMRIVNTDEEMEDAFTNASNEAEKAFKNSTIYMEKAFFRARHIEFQVIGDSRGNAYCVGERECSVQRRHQKIIEETPSCAVSPELRKRISDLCITAVEKSGYTSLGTFEFLMSEHGDLNFLEANTRIQVEHPITEACTGLDLVEIQLNIASDKDVSDILKGVRPKGYAMEFRINAENPFNNFLPSPGRIEKYMEPAGENIRVDSAAYEGYVVPTEFDNLLAKLIITGNSRNEVIGKSRDALDRYTVSGIKTTIPYHRLVL